MLSARDSGPGSRDAANAMDPVFLTPCLSLICVSRHLLSLLTPPPLTFQNQLSGNLLRKFKNSNGWQKLWVVFTNFCLFFYKSHQVRAPHGAAGPNLKSPALKHRGMPP